MRRSPPESATQFAPGVRRRGNDGRMWTVVVASNGVRRWSASASKPKSASRAKPPRAALPAMPELARGPRPRVHHLELCEPATWAPTDRIGGVRFTVGNTMYRKLMRAPKRLVSEFGNAYRWGSSARSGWTRIGAHGNDVAQTGIINLDTVRRAPADAVATTKDIVYRAFVQRGKILHKWDHRPTLSAVQRAAPWVLFLGETHGGDVGATLYVHRSGANIDGVLIDNNCVYADEELVQHMRAEHDKRERRNSAKKRRAS